MFILPVTWFCAVKIQSKNISSNRTTTCGDTRYVQITQLNLSVLYVLPPVGMSDEAIMELNLPTGIPILYELDENLKPLRERQFLGDKETVAKAMAAVAAQGKAKK